MQAPKAIRTHGVAPLIAAGFVLALAGCNGKAPTDVAPQDGPSPQASDAPVDWRQGAENSFIAHRYEQQVTRCWNVQGKFDCLVAQSIGLKDIIPGAPSRLAFFRFQTPALPRLESDLDKLATSDGYACELTTLPDRTVLNETYWKGGRVVQERASGGDGSGHWTPADVAKLRDAAGPGNLRPFFSCPRVIDPVLDVGLFAIDSDLVSYDRVFSAVDYPAAAASKAPADGATGESVAE